MNAQRYLEAHGIDDDFLCSNQGHEYVTSEFMEEYALERLESIKTKINSAILCLSAHPDNEPDSEFADRISDLEEILNDLNK